MKTETLKIKGMTCENCVKHVKEALQSVDGVETATVDLAANAAKVVFDEGKTGIKVLEKAVVDAGYKIKKGLF